MEGSAPWCFTGDQSWEYCTDPSCPGLETQEEVSPHPLNLPGQCCEYALVVVRERVR